MNHRSLAVGRVFLLLIAIALPCAAQEGPEISVTEYGVGRDVVDQELEGKGDQFDEGRKIVFWTRVVGGADGDRIRHVWYREGEEVLSVGLTLGGPHWRTFSRKTLHQGSVGSWRVEARDAQDHILASADFTCVGRGDAERGADSRN
jgi:hypothetical protein